LKWAEDDIHKVHTGKDMQNTKELIRGFGSACPAEAMAKEDSPAPLIIDGFPLALWRFNK